MEVVALSPRGYCYGVVMALKMVKEARKMYPNENIYILGIIIHNKFIQEALKRLDIVSLDDANKTKHELLETIDQGVVIFSAHGIAESVVLRAKEKGLIVFNATCKDVLKTQSIVKDYLKKDYDVLYIGKSNHPEALAMLAIDDRKIKLISHFSDLEHISISDKTIVTNQTTMSVYDTRDLVKRIVEISDKVIVIDEICQATRMRQEALFDLSDFDLLYVVGDTLSNNSNNLAKVGSNTAKKSLLIESVMDINTKDLDGVKRIAVTSGASTPTSITQQVIDYLNKYPNVSEDDLIIDYSKLL